MKAEGERMKAEDGSLILPHFILHPSSFILPPSYLILSSFIT